MKAKRSVVLHHTYVLFNLKDHKLYIGFTTNLEKRVQAHNEGLNKSTRPRRPLKLIYFEAHTLKADALRREAYFKTSSGKRTLKIMLKEVLEELGHLKN